MKKLIAVVCALLLVCSAVSVFADSAVIRPDTPATFRELVGGKTFSARITGLKSTGEDEDTKFRISITVCERDLFDAAAIENLAVRDILYFGDGTATMVMEVTPNEFGFIVKGGNDDTYSFTRTEEGYYTVTTDTDYPFWTDIFAITVPLEKDIRFLDWSDPENLEEPGKRGFDELLDCLLSETDFAPYNTQVTFDENGKLVELLYNYSPWN